MDSFTVDERTRVRRSRRHAGAVVLLGVQLVVAVCLLTAPRAAFGSPLWTKTYAPSGALGLDDARVATAGTGDVYVALTVQHATTGIDLWLARYSPSGARKWVRAYDGPSHLSDQVVALVADRDGNVTVLATSRSTASGKDWLLLRYRRDGRRLWVKRIDGGTSGEDEATDLVADGGGNLYAVGTLHRAGSGFDLAVVKYRPSGRRSWTRVYDILGETEIGGPAALGPNGRLYVCGRTSTPTTNYDFLFVCFTTAGDYRWSRHWGLSDNWDLPRDLVADSRGPVAVGYSDPTSGYSDGLVVALDPDGAFRWYEAYNGAGSRSDDFRAAGLDSDGRVYVAGYATGTSLSRDFFLGRYATNGGSLQSTARNGFEDASDEAACLAVAADGRSYAGGSIRFYAGHTTAYYLGYTAAWGQDDLGVYDAAGSVPDAYESVALSKSAVYLAGTSGLQVLVEKYGR